jgi:hypothetical protein
MRRGPGWARLTGMTRLKWIVALVVAVLGVGTAPSVATAAVHTIAFNDLPPSTTVTNQYADAGGAGQGVVFSGGIPPRITPDGQGADLCSCSGEFGTIDVGGTFVNAKTMVSLSVAAVTGQGDAQVTVELNAYNDSHAKLATASATLTQGGPFQTLAVSVAASSDPAKEIASFEIVTDPHTSTAPLVITDNLTYDIPNPGGPPPVPGFGIHWPGPGYPGTQFATSAGHGVQTAIDISRVNGFAGALTFAASNLPTGVTPVFVAPNPTAGSSIALTFTAAPDAPPVVDQPVTVTATPDPSTGLGPQTTSVVLTVLANYDMEVRGIEVVQAVQEFRSFTQTPADFSAIQLPFRDPNVPSAPVPYSGVKLAAYGHTIARVWADIATPIGLTLPGVTVSLHGYGPSGAELPGSPLVLTEQTLKHDGSGPNVLGSDLVTSGNSFDFDLPAQWTAAGNLQLRAELTPPNLFSTADQSECPTPLCAANNEFTLTGISFVDTNPVTLTLVKITWPGDKAVLPPGQAFAAADSVTPTSEGGVQFDPTNYSATIDISDVKQRFDKCWSAAPQPAKGLSPEERTCLDDANSDAQSELKDWADSNDHNRALIGVGTGRDREMVRGLTSGSLADFFQDPIAVVDQSRPLGSVAHEWFHELGRNHASSACNATGSDYWPPDQQGFLNGVGFDRDGVLPPPRTNGTIAATATSPAYDFMGYCAQEPDTWVSPLGWNWVLQYLHDHRGDQAYVASAAHGPALRVLGYVSPDGVHIASVTPVLGGAAARPAIGAPGSEFSLVVRGGAGQTLTNVPMQATGAHVDHVGPVALLDATVPLAGAAGLAGDVRPASGATPASVSILQNGTVAVTRARPRHAPRVRVIAPRAGALVGHGRSVIIRYRVRDPGVGGLRAVVAYSSDDGRTFKTLYIGPATGRATLPSALLARSRAARIRVAVSDGFNLAAAFSARFAAAGAPPRVTIVSPKRRTRIAADGALELDGTAFDDRGQPVRGAALTWYAGRRRLGRGTRLFVQGLAPGRMRLRLLARGADGQLGSASVVVLVRPAAPRVLSLATPRTVPASAAAMGVTIATTEPATLRVGGRRYAVSRRARRLTIRFKRGSSQIVLTLTADHLRTMFMIVVARH